MQSPFHLSEFSRSSLAHALAASGWLPLDLEAGGTNPYPVPRPVGAGLRAIERIGARLGAGLNMTVVAQRA